jgi:hypothetical protein
MVRLVRYPVLDLRITGATVQSERAEVTLTLVSEVPGAPMGRFDSTVREVWQRVRGRWCKADEPVLMPFPGHP